MPAQPADARPERGRCARSQAAGQGRAGAIHLVVTPVHCSKAIRPDAGITLARLNG
jgi:hypothetical protein